MSGMGDGVNKVFSMFVHQNSLIVNGFKTRFETIRHLLYTGYNVTGETELELLAEVQKLIAGRILTIQREKDRNELEP
jgi:hypothetical protein